MPGELLLQASFQRHGISKWLTVPGFRRLMKSLVALIRRSRERSLQSLFGRPNNDASHLRLHSRLQSCEAITGMRA